MKQSKIMLKGAVLSVALVTMIEAGIAPALPGIAKAFPSVDISLIQLVATIPGLLTIPASLLCGVISKWIGKRVLTIASLILFLITSLAPIFTSNFTFLLTMRALSGATCGFLLTLSAALIPDFFQGKEQKTMLGLKNASANLGGILTSFFGGILATINWNVSFWVFAIGFIPLILTLFFLPEPKKVEEAEAAAKKERISEKRKSPYNVYLVFLCAGYFFFMMLYFGFYANNSFVIVGEKMGDAATAGYLLTLSTIGGVIGGIVFGKINDLFKRFTGAVSIGLMAICFLIFAFSHNLIAYFIAGFIFGIIYAMISSLVFVAAADRVPETSTTIWFSILVCLMGLGGTVSSFILVPIGKAMGGSLYRSIFTFSGICLIVGCIIMIVYPIITRNAVIKYSEYFAADRTADKDSALQ